MSCTTDALTNEAGDRPAFHGLLLWLLGTRSYALAPLATDEELASERATKRKEGARVDAVIGARHARLLARRSKN